MYSNIIKEFENIKKIYPNVKYIESEYPDLIDDRIHLTEKLHIQVPLRNEGMYALIKRVGYIYHYLATSESLKEVMFYAICEAQPDGIKGMN